MSYYSKKLALMRAREIMFATRKYKWKSSAGKFTRIKKIEKEVDKTFDDIFKTSLKQLEPKKNPCLSIVRGLR